MDVDTPPRPSFPPSATATSNPFHFAPPPPATERTLPDGHLDFDTAQFDPKDAFGLSEAEVELDQSVVGDDSMLDGEQEEQATSSALSVIAGGDSRRRRGGGASAGSSRRERSSERRRGSKGEDGDEQETDGRGAMLGGRRMQGSEFSFQVHHHHAGEGQGGAATPLPERWLNSNTPYVLLG